MTQSELLADLMTTAIEGGVNYWCLRIDPDPRPRPGNTPWYADPTFYAKHTWALRIYTLDVPDTPLPYIVTKQNMLDTLNTLSTTTPLAHNDILTESWDADTADVILQLAAFGEVRYG